jgi:pilus assembly protein TadC
MTSLLSAAALTACAVLLAAPPSARHRIKLLRSPPGSAAWSSARWPPGVPRVAACTAAGLSVALFVEGVVGAVVGGAVGVGVWVLLGRLEPAARRRRREALRAALPLGVDLFAACLAVGRPPAESLRVVADAVGSPLADELATVSARMALGGDPVEVWRQAGAVPELEPLARTMARSAETGAPAADALARLADDLRRERRASMEQAARSVGVQAAAPLGLCFLPAFVLVGIVPSVVSVFASLELW